MSEEKITDPNEKKLFRTKIVFLLVGIAIAVPMWYWALEPMPDVTVPIDNTIDKMAEEKGITVIKMPPSSGKITLENPEQFFQLAQKNDSRPRIGYSRSESGSSVTVTYYSSLDDGRTIVLERSYEIPSLLYKVKGSTDKTAVFEKDFLGTTLVALIICWAYLTVAFGAYLQYSYRLGRKK